MINPVRCCPSLAKLALPIPALLIGLALGGCGYSPDRTLIASSAASPKTSRKVEKTHTGVRKSAEYIKAADKKIRDQVVSHASSSTSSPYKKSVATNSERECLVRAMYFESQRSNREGLLAVATVVMNRVNSPSYPNSICGVVGQKHQFAPGVLARPMAKRERVHADAVADQVFAGKRHTGIGDAMFFHVATRRYKYSNMRYLQVAGGNIFYTKVGRNAPRVVAGPVLAYADTASEKLQAEDATVEAAKAETTTTAAVDTPTTSQPDGSAEAIIASIPAINPEKIQLIAPFEKELSRAQSFSTKPLVLAQYRLQK